MPLVLSGSTSGSITVDAPAVAGTNTLTLPASTGTILTTTSPKAGNVIQVVGGTLATESNTSSTSFVSTNLTASITPASSSNKIYIVATFTAYTSGGGRYTIYRNSSNVVAAALGQISTGEGDTTVTISYLDSPSTTSSTTYTVYYRSTSGQTYIGVNNLTCQITLMEIAA